MSGHFSDPASELPEKTASKTNRRLGAGNGVLGDMLARTASKQSGFTSLKGKQETTSITSSSINDLMNSTKVMVNESRIKSGSQKWKDRQLMHHFSESASIMSGESGTSYPASLSSVDPILNEEDPLHRDMTRLIQDSHNKEEEVTKQEERPRRFSSVIIQNKPSRSSSRSHRSMSTTSTARTQRRSSRSQPRIRSESTSRRHRSMSHAYTESDKSPLQKMGDIPSPEKPQQLSMSGALPNYTRSLTESGSINRQPQQDSSEDSSLLSMSRTMSPTGEPVIPGHQAQQQRPFDKKQRRLSSRSTSTTVTTFTHSTAASSFRDSNSHLGGVQPVTSSRRPSMGSTASRRTRPKTPPKHHDHHTSDSSSYLEDTQLLKSSRRPSMGSAGSRKPDALTRLNASPKHGQRKQVDSKQMSDMHEDESTGTNKAVVPSLRVSQQEAPETKKYGVDRTTAQQQSVLSSESASSSSLPPLPTCLSQGRMSSANKRDLVNASTIDKSTRKYQEMGDIKPDSGALSSRRVQKGGSISKLKPTASSYNNSNFEDIKKKRFVADNQNLPDQKGSRKKIDVQLAYVHINEEDHPNGYGGKFPTPFTTVACCQKEIRRRTLLLTCLILFATIIAIVAIILHGTSSMRNGKPEDGTTNQPTDDDESLPSSPVTFVTDLLVDNQFIDLESTPDLLENMTSPQAKAFQWLVVDLPSIRMSKNAIALDLKTQESILIQRYILVVLYYSTFGSLWVHSENWLQHDQSACTWYGVSCNPDGVGVLDQRSIVGLQLEENGMAGTLPLELRGLSFLELLSFEQNLIEGTIPDMLASLSKLAVIDLQFNKLTGSIPKSLGTIPNLEELNLAGNQLSGVSPGAICDLGLSVFVVHCDFVSCSCCTVPCN